MNLKSFFVRYISKLSPRLYFIIAYVHNRGRFPHFKNPRDLSEIWVKEVLDGKFDSVYYLADKYRVRKYVIDKGLGRILTPLIEVYDNPNDICLDVLPTKFALKANYGAGMNYICLDKSLIRETELRKIAASWLARHKYSHSEKHYNLIQRRIICEEYIDDGSGGFPIDYKFMCIKGKVSCILACSGRDKHAEYLPYSTAWLPLQEWYRGSSTARDILKRPDNLEDMIHVAEKLSEGIDLVRVDLYSNGSRIWFGEMTLTPSGCIFHRWTREAIDEMGRQYRECKY